MSVKTLTEQILAKMPKVGRWQFKFLVTLFPLWLGMRGRYNFCHLARWGCFGEDTYRHQFGKPFDWLSFNTQLAKQHLSKDLIIAFDPSYLPKSGKSTPGIGSFYSGCAGRELRGLELGGLAVIDQQDKTALHLEAVQTLPDQSSTLVEWYARILTERAKALHRLSDIVVADAYFARRGFVEALRGVRLRLITRLRSDARLRYLYHGPQKKGRGRRRQYAGRIDPKNLDLAYVQPCARAEDGAWVAYELVANVQAWKGNARLVIVQHLDADGQVEKAHLLASTDPNMSGQQVLLAYHSRFQIELLYRDAKQHTGLTHCQARSEAKLHFHLNASLTVVSLAKVAHHRSEGKAKSEPFSMADIKTQYANELLLDRFISTFGIDPKLSKIKSVRESIRKVGRIAA